MCLYFCEDWIISSRFSRSSVALLPTAFLSLSSFRKLFWRFSAWYNVCSLSPYVLEWFSLWIFYSVLYRRWKTMALVLSHHQPTSCQAKNIFQIHFEMSQPLSTLWDKFLVELIFFDQFTEICLQETYLTLQSSKINPQKVLV